MAGDRGNANVKGTDVELAFPSRSPGGSGERTAPARERGPWWQIWRSRGRWQELATHEKEQILPTDRPPGTRNIFTLLLVASVSINVILLLVLLGLAVTGNLYIKRVKGGNLLGSWAVDEASTVVNAAMVSCSGKGLRFADSIGGGCECNQCYEGPNCSQLTLNCTLDLSRYNAALMFAISMLVRWSLCLLVTNTTGTQTQGLEAIMKSRALLIVEVFEICFSKGTEKYVTMFRSR